METLSDLSPDEFVSYIVKILLPFQDDNPPDDEQRPSQEIRHRQPNKTPVVTSNDNNDFIDKHRVEVSGDTPESPLTAVANEYSTKNVVKVSNKVIHHILFSTVNSTTMNRSVENNSATGMKRESTTIHSPLWNEQLTIQGLPSNLLSLFTTPVTEPLNASSSILSSSTQLPYTYETLNDSLDRYFQRYCTLINQYGQGTQYSQRLKHLYTFLKAKYSTDELTRLLRYVLPYAYAQLWNVYSNPSSLSADTINKQRIITDQPEYIHLTNQLFGKNVLDTFIYEQSMETRKNRMDTTMKYESTFSSAKELMASFFEASVSTLSSSSSIPNLPLLPPVDDDPFSVVSIPSLTKSLITPVSLLGNSTAQSNTITTTEGIESFMNGKDLPDTLTSSSLHRLLHDSSQVLFTFFGLPASELLVEEKGRTPFQTPVVSHDENPNTIERFESEVNHRNNTVTSSLPVFTRLPKLKTPRQRSQEWSSSVSFSSSSLPSNSSTLSSSCRGIPHLPKVALPTETLSRLQCEEFISKCLLLALHGIGSDLFVIRPVVSSVSIVGLATLRELYFAESFLQPVVTDLKLPLVLVPFYEQACFTVADIGTQYLYLEDICKYYLHSEEESSVAREIDANIGKGLQEILTLIAGHLLDIIYALNRRALYYQYYPHERSTSMLRPLVTVSRTMNRMQPYITILRSLFTLFRTSSSLPHGPSLLQHLFEYTHQTLNTHRFSMDTESIPLSDNLIDLSSVFMYLFETGIQPLLIAVERQIGRRIITTNGSNLDGILHSSINENVVTDPTVLTQLPSFLSTSKILSSLKDASIPLKESTPTALIRCADTFTLIRQSCASLARSFTNRTVDHTVSVPNMYIPSLYIPYTDYQIYTNNQLITEHIHTVLQNIQNWANHNIHSLQEAANGTGRSDGTVTYPNETVHRRNTPLDNVELGDSASVNPFDKLNEGITNEANPPLPFELSMMVKIMKTLLHNYENQITNDDTSPNDTNENGKAKVELSSLEASSAVNISPEIREDDYPNDNFSKMDGQSVTSYSTRDVFSQVQEGIRTDQFETTQHKRARAIAEAREVRSEQNRRELEEQAQVNERKRQEFERLTNEMEKAKERKEQEKRQKKDENNLYLEELRRAEELSISPLKGLRNNSSGKGSTDEVSGSTNDTNDNVNGAKSSTLPENVVVGSLSSEDDLYVTARLVLLRDFGERLKSLNDTSTNDDAVMIALEALVSLGPSGAKQAQQLAKILGITGLDDPTGNDNDIMNTSVDNQSYLSVDNHDNDDSTVVAKPTRTSLNLFRVLPELETLLAEPIVTQIRILQPSGGGFDSAKEIIQGNMYDDVMVPSSLPVHSRISRPPGGVTSLTFGSVEKEETVNETNSVTVTTSSVHYSPVKSIIYGTDDDKNYERNNDKDDSSSLITHIRINQPIGGTSTINEYLYQDGNSKNMDSTDKGLKPSLKNLSNEVQQILHPVQESLVHDTVESTVKITSPTVSQEEEYHPSTKVLQPTGGYSSIGSIIHIGEAVDTLRTVTDAEGKTLVTKEETVRPQIKVNQSPGGVSSMDSVLYSDQKNFVTRSKEEIEEAVYTHIHILQPSGGGSNDGIRQAMYGGAWGNDLHHETEDASDVGTENDYPQNTTIRVRPSVQITQEPGGNSTVQKLLYLQKPDQQKSTARTIQNGSIPNKSVEKHEETVLPSTTIPQLAVETFVPNTFVHGFNEQLGALFFSTNNIPNRLLPLEDEDNDKGNTTTDPALPIDMEEPVFTKRNTKQQKNSSGSLASSSHGLFYQRRKPFYSGPFSIAIQSGILNPLRSHITLMDISGVLLLVYHYDLLTHLKALRDCMFGGEGYMFTTFLDYLCGTEMNDRGRNLIHRHNELLHRLATLENTTITKDATNTAVQPTRAELVSLITTNRKKITVAFNSYYRQACSDTGILNEFDTYIQEAKRRLRSHLYHGTKENNNSLTNVKDSSSTNIYPVDYSVPSSITAPLSTDAIRNTTNHTTDSVYSETIASILLESRAHCNTSALGANMHRFTYEALPVYEYVSPLQLETLGYWNSQMFDNLVIPQYNLHANPLTYMDHERQEWLKRTLGRKAIERIRTTKGTESYDTASHTNANHTVTWSPIELVLTPEAMVRYASLHMFILRLRRTEKELLRSWLSLMSLKRYTTPRLYGWAVNSAEDALTGLTIPFTIYTFRHEASYFLHCLNGYITTTVLENGYRQLLRNIEYILCGKSKEKSNLFRSDQDNNNAEFNGSSFTPLLTVEDSIFGKIDGIKYIHDHYLASLLYRCFIPDPLSIKETTDESTINQGTNQQRYKASQLIHNVLNTILEFCSLIEEQTKTVDQKNNHGTKESPELLMERIPIAIFPPTIVDRIQSLRVRFTQSIYLLIKGLQQLSVQGGGYSYIDDLLLRLGPWIISTTGRSKK